MVNNKAIKLLVMDVDGTLTDGKIYMGASGEMMKAFNIKDGYAICNILPKYGILPVIITGRQSQIVLNRCSELNIKDVYQNVSDKVEKLKEILSERNFSMCNVAYIGDDSNDIPCMMTVKDGNGLVGCPSDAVKKVKELADFVSEESGGNGAVREFIEWIIANN